VEEVLAEAFAGCVMRRASRVPDHRSSSRSSTYARSRSCRSHSW
jgi:hypothetical protein